jgi:pimeloyl-ACP methyl ester carboxylesterase
MVGPAGEADRKVVSVSATDGRALEVVLAGPPGVPMVCRHGTPGTAGPFAALVDTGAERDVRHIAYSHPGYGGGAR